MRALLVLAALVAVALAAPTLSDLPVRLAWQSFKAKYAKQYESAAEEQKRFTIFKGNYEFINAHNKRTDVTYSVGINAFADLTNPEFVSMMNGYRPSNKPRKDANFKLGTRTCPPGQTGSSDYNSTCDWRAAGVVTPVKNQGQCGSCWSFSTTGSTEGAHALATGNLVSLSEQNLIDCSTAEGNQGCNGGIMDDAFTYIIKNNGIDTEASYPYQAQGPLQCRFKTANIGATLSSFKDVQKGSELALQAASGTVGPISVAIDASHNSFQFYQSGVYYEPACSTTQLDHGVLVVGYGNSSGTDYWIVKNSWGTTWGQAGYIWMSRNRNNNCGIATMASYPIAGNSPATSNSGPSASASGPAASGPATSRSASGPAASNSGPSASGPAASHSGPSATTSNGPAASSGKSNSSGNQASSGSSGNQSSSGSNSSGSSGNSSGSSNGSSNSSGSSNGSSGSSGNSNSSGSANASTSGSPRTSRPIIQRL